METSRLKKDSMKLTDLLKEWSEADPKLDKRWFKPFDEPLTELKKKQVERFETIEEVSYNHKLLRRGQGLVDRKAYYMFMTAGNKLADDLEGEGFEDDDITDWFIALVTKAF